MTRRPWRRTAAALVAALLAATACSGDSIPAPLDEAAVNDPDVLARTQGRLSADEVLDPMPPLSPEELVTPPVDTWPTNGGDVFNRRFSPLDQIDTTNVDRLGGMWRTRLGSGFGGKYSGEATPIVYDGVIYLSTGANDVFALDVETGEVLWRYDADLYDSISTICCAWANRGVAIGDGKVFLGRLDGQLVALDQRTGDLVWSARLGRWQEGQTITAAPLYYDGVVYSGLSGGEYGVRGRVYALDAETGDELWRFYTVPGPGEPGHETWPEDGDIWQHGGSVVWNTPAVDPELGLLYFATSNPGELFNGHDRPGANLFSNSMMALDLETGEYRWHYQQVHHDLWDYDAASPVVLFDVEIDGEVRQAIAEASKTGWVYVLDRATGEPLVPIVERPVPQDDYQNTWPTQPFPVGDSFVPQSIPADLAERLEHASPIEWQYVNEGRIYTPPSPVGPILKPATLGGANWPPSSFSPETGYLYVCASDTISIFGTDDEEYDPSSIRSGEQFLGSAFAAPTGAPLHGTFTAMDMRTNTIAWQQVYDRNGDNCYSGSVATGGGLVFMGRNDGRIVAYDAADGGELWSYDTGAGANAPPVTFEHEGTQYVLQYSAGNALAGSPRGDIVTLLSLDGDLPPIQTSVSAGVRERQPERAPGREP